MTDQPGLTKGELRAQWTNPGDVLSLLLLIGGDIVQKAIAQLIGRTIRPFKGSNLEIGIAPVAFSFGWVAYAFTNLLSAVGEKQLMPTADQQSIVVNCENGFVRSNQSWILARLLRDHEAQHEIDPRGRDSIRIDIFELGAHSKPSIDGVWWLGWLIMIVQVGIALVPWILHGDWGIMMIIICGNFMALLTCALPQWRDEKWAGRILTSDKVMCLTRGNGHYHIMVLIGRAGSWDIETLATATSAPRPETMIVSLSLAVLWICLLISVSGLKANAWYLIGVGGVGMLQNIYAAGAEREPSTSDIHLTKYSPVPTIVGKRRPVPKDDEDAGVELDDNKAKFSELSDWTKREGDDKIPDWLDSMDGSHGMPEWLIPLSNRPEGNEKIENVHGALMELERWVPTAGVAMLQIFFPAGLSYKDEAVKYNFHKKFWKKAYHVCKIRRKAEEKKRQIRRKQEAAKQEQQGVNGLP
jgi:hypothetical protein